MNSNVYKLTPHLRNADTHYVHTIEGNGSLYLGQIRFNRLTGTWSLHLDGPGISWDDVTHTGHPDEDAAVTDLMNGYRKYLQRGVDQLDSSIRELGHEPAPLQPIPLRTRLFDAVKDQDERQTRLAGFMVAIWRIARREAIGELVKMADEDHMDSAQRVGVNRAIKRLQDHPVLKGKETQKT